MRWPLSRRTGGDGAKGSGGTKRGSSAPGGVPAALPVLRAPRRDWERLGPIQLMVGAPPLVAPNARFVGALTTRRASVTGLAPLAHRVAPDAPGGLVKGSAKPLPPKVGDLPVVPLPVGTTDLAVDRVAPVRADVTPAPPPGDRMVSAALFESRAIAPPSRPAPVQRAARDTAPRPPGDTGTPPWRRVSLGESRRQGLGRRDELPLATSAPSESPALETAAVPGDARPVAPPPTAAPERPPLVPAVATAATPPAPVQRAAAAPVAPSSVVGPAVSRSAVPTLGPTPPRFRIRPVSSLDAAGSAPAQMVPVPAAQALPVARSVEPAQALPAREPHQFDARPDGGAEPAAGVEPFVAEAEPLFVAAPRRGVDASPNDASDRPIVSSTTSPTVTPPRRVEAVPEPLRAAVQRQVGADLSGAMIERGPAVDAQARQLDALAYTSAATIHLPDHHGGLETREAQALVAHELVHVAQQRTLGPALPSESSSRGRRLEGQAVVAERQRRAAGPLPLAQESRAAESRRTTPESPRSMQRVADEMVSAGMAVRIPGGIQLTGPQPDAAAAPRQPAPEPPPSGAVQRAAAVPATAGSPALPAGSTGGGESDADLERLAGKLYDRIRSRLRSELVIDRERAGLATEF